MKNRIMFVSRTLSGGGAERFVANVASYLADNGNDIYLLLYERKENEYPLSGKVKVLEMPQEAGKMKRIVSMKKIFKNCEPDIVIPFIDTVVLCAYFAQRFLNTRFVYTVRNSPWDEKENRLVKIMKSTMIRNADFIMLQNEEQAMFFKDKFKNKEIVIPNPVAPKFICTSKTHYEDAIKNIIYVGRLEEQKNIPLLLEVFEKVHRSFPNATLKIYGEGVMKNQIKKRISELGLENSCYLCGRSGTIENELQKADLFILPSNYEGMPNSLIEAMAVGVPCISSDCRTGPKSLIKQHISGLLFKTKDSKSLEDNMVWALHHPLEMADYGRNARKYILDNLTVDKIVVRILEMLK